MCYMRRKIEGGVDALREFDDTNFLKPNGQSRNLNIYDPNITDYYIINRAIPSIITIENRHQIDFGKPECE